MTAFQEILAFGAMLILLIASTGLVLSIALLVVVLRGWLVIGDGK